MEKENDNKTSLNEEAPMANQEEKSSSESEDECFKVLAENNLNPKSEKKEKKEASEKKALKAAKKKARKEKKKAPGRVEEKKPIFISLILAVVCGAAGSFGGMFLYDKTHPIEANKVVLATDSTSNSAKAEKIKASLKAGSLMDDFKNRPYDIVSYACYKQALSPYSLQVGYSYAYSSMSSTQVWSATYGTPDEVFYQNISNTSAAMGISVNTAYRFYDKKAGSIEGYENKKTSDWETDTSDNANNYTYDDYIQTYGKLFKADYFCTSDSSLTVTDKYLTDSQEEFTANTDTTKHEVNGVVAYVIASSTTNSSTFTECAEGGYDINLTMNASKASYYYRIQMKKTGGLTDYPTFSSTVLKFHLDDDLNLVYSEFNDTYHGNMSVISVDLDMTLYQRYYQAETADGFKDKDGKAISLSVPEINDVSDPFTSNQIYDFSSSYEKLGE